MSGFGTWHDGPEWVWNTFEALNPSIRSMIRCKSSCCGSLASRCVSVTTGGCSLLLSEAEAVFSGTVVGLMSSGRACSSSLPLSAFFFTCQESNAYNNGTSCHSAQKVKKKKKNKPYGWNQLMGCSGCHVSDWNMRRWTDHVWLKSLD